MDLNYSNPLPFYYLLIFFLVISILFKFNELIYIFPYLIQFKLNNEFLIIIFLLIVAIFFGYFVFFKKKIFTLIKNYSATRTFKKPLKFFLKNFLIMSAIYVWSYYIFLNGDLFIKSMIILLYLNYHQK